ncbi:PRC-barrel domain-containing protein [Candidatus Marsarchaeota archaeon]|jgi:sporulation protein YlmC with PRC-barrel domain|nr:PRC-barrel domain-containing protein [Candidatus Marsarchaeota archaeon]MCL5090223.1 PRC-barrel domain-containing protein [Candidatus Marsarchaeota archaeon]
MAKFVIAKQLVGKKVISTSGYDLGRFVDAEVNKVSGKITYLLVEANVDSALANKLSEDGQVKVPYNAVTAVADYIMVDTKNMSSVS